MASRYTAQGKCWLEKLTHRHGFIEEPNGRWKEQWGTEALHSSEPQKKHISLGSKIAAAGL